MGNKYKRYLLKETNQSVYESKLEKLRKGQGLKNIRTLAILDKFKRTKSKDLKHSTEGDTKKKNIFTFFQNFHKKTIIDPLKEQLNLGETDMKSPFIDFKSFYTHPDDKKFFSNFQNTQFCVTLIEKDFEKNF